MRWAVALQVAPPMGTGGLAGYRCTTGQVRVRVTPLMAWMRDTTSSPRASMLLASARTMTSYGPVRGWAWWTPLISATALATWPAVPTSVWMRTYALTSPHHLPNVALPSQAGTPLQAVWSVLGGHPG